MIQLAIERLKEHFRGSGCGSSMGCFKGKEIQTYLDGKLRSDVLDIITQIKALQEQIKEHEDKLREVESMNKEAIIKLGNIGETVEKLTKLPVKFMFYIVAGNTLSFGAIIGLLKLLGGS